MPHKYILQNFINRLLLSLIIIPTITNLYPETSSKYSEHLEYKIKWKYMVVGYSTLSRQENIYFEGNKVWMFESTARANAVIQTIFPVNDRIISLWDPKKSRSLWHEKNLSEGDYKRINQVHFNYEDKKAVWWQKQYSGNVDDRGLFTISPEWKFKNGVMDQVNENMYDILSLIHITRTNSQTQADRDEFSIPIFDDSRISNVSIKIIGNQTIEMHVNGGYQNFDSILVEPKIETSGLFKSNGRIQVWVSNDERRIPLKVRAEVPNLGTVEANLFRIH
ncbi:DUF3108 domain-containing protein [Leptospira sp. GIMC2001]|uniref:DUF3108 domain-containing protein n=1 Tax=Leptospira sp. GIMC2001 TaxID=1513297 RepID=UPI00234930CA|nr:DUF3108 domain-containing protein [Leptospira sp. GIMC2001]WCL49846.1 DUF3108 domain-containing protein [Leptospira sp. GIMC2001]